jgi:mRNA interferase RelE/StbE
VNLYEIEILRSAQKQLAKIDKSDQQKIIACIENLSHNPRPFGCKKLTGRPAWRIRVGNFRVIYEIEDQRLRILIVTIGNRRDVYK